MKFQKIFKPIPFAAFLLGVSFSLAGQVLADKPGFGHGPGQGGMGQLASIVDNLELTPEQMTQLKQMRENIHSECFLENRGPAVFMLEALVMDDREQLHKMVDQDLEKMRTSMYCVLDKILVFKSTLSPDQKEILRLKAEEAKTERERWIDKWSKDDQNTNH